MRALALVLIVVAGCGNGPPGYLEPCSLKEDCDNAGLECANVQNNYTNHLTDERYCTPRCTSDADCPRLECADWIGTDLECPDTVQFGGHCGNGAIGDVRLMVCGM